MKTISEIIKNEAVQKKSKFVAKRHLIVGDIAKRLDENSYKKISLPILGKILARFLTSELYSLHKECIDAKNYAAMFWFKTKRK